MTSLSMIRSRRTLDSAVDKALDATEDAVLRELLDETRTAIAPCLGLLGRSRPGSEPTRRRCGPS